MNRRNQLSDESLKETLKNLQDIQSIFEKTIDPENRKSFVVLCKEHGYRWKNVRRLVDIIHHAKTDVTEVIDNHRAIYCSYDKLYAEIFHVGTRKLDAIPYPEDYIETTDELIRTKLNERERYILDSYYGLSNDAPMSLDEIGERFGLTRERVRQIKMRAICKLRYPKNQQILQMGLKEYRLKTQVKNAYQEEFEAQMKQFQEQAREQAKRDAKEEYQKNKKLIADMVSYDTLQYAKSIPIDNLPYGFASLSTRTSNCLKRNNLTRMYDVLQLTKENIYNLRSLGKKSVNEILELQNAWFSKYGIEKDYFLYLAEKEKIQGA